MLKLQFHFSANTNFNQLWNKVRWLRTLKIILFPSLELEVLWDKYCGYLHFHHWADAFVQSDLQWYSHRCYLSMRTSAGIPPDLYIARSPSFWCDRLWSTLAVQRVVSMSAAVVMARTTAPTTAGDCTNTRRLASLRVSWLTIMAALFTTTYKDN